VIEHRRDTDFRSNDRDRDDRRDADHDGRRDADFRGGDSAFRGWGESYTVYCPSDDMGRAWCPADARFGVRMIRQRSQAACIEGQTWGSGKRGIWVDRGCRADFSVSGDWKSRAAGFVYCPSDHMNRNFCGVDTRDGVFIVRQRSEADCVFNRTWGYDRDRIWSIAAAAPISKLSTAATANGVNGPATGTTTTAAAGIATMTATAIVTEMIVTGIVTEIVTEIATATITATAHHT